MPEIYLLGVTRKKKKRKRWAISKSYMLTGLGMSMFKCLAICEGQIPMDDKLFR